MRMKFDRDQGDWCLDVRTSSSVRILVVVK